MTKQSDNVGHADLTGGGQTNLHSHAGGGGEGANVKSGSLVPASKTWVAVSFAASFASVPTVAGAVSKNTSWSLRNVTVDGFEVYLNTTGSNTFWWIATDAGNL